MGLAQKGTLYLKLSRIVLYSFILNQCAASCDARLPTVPASFSMEALATLDITHRFESHLNEKISLNAGQFILIFVNRC